MILQLDYKLRKRAFSRDIAFKGLNSRYRLLAARRNNHDLPCSGARAVIVQNHGALCGACGCSMMRLPRYFLLLLS
jgi:hypothetical protein